jgi:hypothetical protein
VKVLATYCGDVACRVVFFRPYASYAAAALEVLCMVYVTSVKRFSAYIVLSEDSGNHMGILSIV